MRLASVKLKTPTADPAQPPEHAAKFDLRRDGFTVEGGYELTLAGSFVRVVHVESGRHYLVPLSDVLFAVEQQDSVAVAQAEEPLPMSQGDGGASPPGQPNYAPNPKYVAPHKHKQSGRK